MAILNIASCTRCRLGTRPLQHMHIVPGAGNPEAKILIVGESPDQRSAILGKVFVDEAAMTLETMLEHGGIAKADVYVTHVCKCHAWGEQENKKTGHKSPVARTPEKDEVRACSIYLQQEIQHLRPKVIITLGEAALSALEGRVCKMKDRLGVVSIYKGIKDKTNRTYIVPTQTPQYVIRNGGVKTAIGLSVVAQEVAAHFALAKQLVDDTTIFAEHKYTQIDSYEKLRHMVDLIKAKRICTFDYETEGLSVDDRILGIGFGADVGEAYYIPFWVRPTFGTELEDFWEVREVPAATVIEACKEILADPNIRKSAHNSKFDMRCCIKQWGWDVQNLWWDTMVGSYLIDENAAHGLKVLKNKYIDLLGYEEQWNSETNGGDHSSRASLETITQYCCGDADATFRITREQVAFFSDRPTYMNLMANFYRPLLPIIKDMEAYGVRYEVARASGVGEEYKKRAEEIKVELMKQAGCVFDPNSPAEVGKVLFGVLKLVHPKKTDTGMASVDAEVLEDLAEQHPVPNLIVEYRHVNKMRSTYIEGFMEDIASDGRLHIGINPIGTKTGRLSSEGLMNIPGEPAIKSLITAPPGSKLVCADLSQAEVRCFAHYANESVLREAYEDDKVDLHCLIASEIIKMDYATFKAHVDEEKKNKTPGKYSALRQAAKSVVFGILFGRGAASIANENNMTVQEAEAFIAQFFGRFTNCKQWIDSIHKLVEKTGEVSNIFGRIRRIPAIWSKDEDKKARAKRQAVNSIIQSTASDITNRALIAVYNEIKRQQIPAHILFTVYDSIIIETPDECIDIIKPMLIQQMELKPHPDFSIKIKADLDVYQSWGTKL